MTQTFSTRPTQAQPARRRPRDARETSAGGSRQLRSSRWVWRLPPALLGLLLGACGTPVGVSEVGPSEVYAAVNANALAGGVLSERARQTLSLAGLWERYEKEPLDAIRALHAVTEHEQQRRALLYTLSETMHLYAVQNADKDAHLASALYAYQYLLGDEALRPPDPYNRSFRVGCDLYARGIQEAFSNEEGQMVAPREGLHELPIGSVHLRFDRSGMPDSDTYTKFLPADSFLIEGFTVRGRQSGLGTPLIAVGSRNKGPEDAESPFLFPTFYSAATLFLRVEGGIAAFTDGELKATLEVHGTLDEATVKVGERVLPLEADFTAPLAYSLSGSPLWNIGVFAFLGKKSEFEPGLYMSTRYEPEKIPVVFVHGTASSPAAWAEMLNSLNSDPFLRQHFQPWYFFYETAAPISLSGAQLRAQLRDIVQAVDPEGDDEELREMVLIGHSQGGLLCRMQVVQGGAELWERSTGVPLEELDLDPEEKQHLLEAMYFEPSPNVSRVIYMATPHRGSFMTSRWFVSILLRMMTVPQGLTSTFKSMFDKNADKLPPEFSGVVPTSLASMNPGNPFLEALALQPTSERVTSHSIIAVRGQRPVDEDSNDGVVEYRSAHLDGVESELVVRSGHSCQWNPFAVLEVRRILQEHARSLGLEPAPISESR